ncbi:MULTISPECIES: hypothetical protein [unclassified Ruminococcus]|uniref:hypothetical protein n=1 Tax=unclassified Ruminococcus TaxID=2608920 RepID=UPI00210B6D13|nr:MULTISPECIES: hypothetical protein [unclassified Ruminococcus]MCQ4023300.1 hypothetical protein [Ruminococcus sp. zg-924]MCQ4115643.1 hypothetical protein [Ruminococcus sp. zg-921]
MLKKVISLITSAAIMAAVLVGCSCSGETQKATSSGATPNAVNNSAVDGNYVNENYKYKLTIPSEVKDEISINGNDSIVTIYNKYVKELNAKDEKGNKYEGKLGTIWAENLNSTISFDDYVVLGKDSNRQYVFQYPAEQQYDPKDKKAKENYEHTKKYLQEILDSFSVG